MTDEDAYPENMLEEGDVFADQESRNLYYKALEKNENEDVTEESETTENDGTDDEKVLEQGYDVQLTFEDDSTAELHAFPFGDIEKGDLCYADDVAYLTYTSIESKEQIDTKEAELAVKQAAEQKAAEEAAAKAAAAAKEKYASVSTPARSSYSASADEIHLLAASVYWESGWHPANGQLAVANVVLNRVLSSRFSQNTIASVIYAPGQFSGVAENGAPSARFQAVLNMSNEQLNQRGCYDAAVTALSGQNNIGDLFFFINVRKANYNKYTSYTIINNHCFYIY